ncbi:MAG: glycosyl hydrolase, partial [Planctomycetota bacterium]
MLKPLLQALLFVPFLLTPSLAQDAESDTPKTKLSTSTIGAISFRNIGPALTSGRIADLAIDQEQPNTWYVAVGSGNVWKTVNAGTTWKPIFENYGSYSIGCITIDPNNRSTIWVGTGENVGGRHVGYGDGVYVSHDGGSSFKNMGLKESEHISKIVVDPRDSNVVFVAAQGPLWSSGGERGLYRSADGGKTWKQVLSAGEWTGVTDVAMDPKNPDVMYAATHQRHRTVWGLMNGGPESGIHKSTDGGKTWRKLRGGLPGGDLGKMSIAVSPQKSNVVYAAIELTKREGGVWRSENAGASWRKMSDYVAGGTGPHYYQEIYCDPHRFDVVYHANVRLGRTEDGGATFKSVANSNKHVDNHAVAFHPTDPDFVLVGCDGGLYRSFDYGKTYDYFANLPLTQFYKVDVDYDEPFYNVVGGTQDNNTQYGPTRTRNSEGIRNADWRITIGGDGHDCAIDPEDPNIIYCESQEGYLRRFDRRSGESIRIRPEPAEDEGPLRFNWDSPILISPHSHTRLYFGSRRLHRSDDRGDSWKTISPDLSRQRDRFTLPYMGRVWPMDSALDLYAMSQYGNITSISESAVQEDLIYVGTDDGLIHVTEDGGENWTKIDKIYDVPVEAFVNDIKADRHDANTVYVVFDNHKKGDFAPYVLKSTDRGKNWVPIRGNLSDRNIVWRIEQDHVNPELLFLGTEFGVYYTRDAADRE